MGGIEERPPPHASSNHPCEPIGVEAALGVANQHQRSVRRDSTQQIHRITGDVCDAFVGQTLGDVGTGHSDDGHAR